MKNVDISGCKARQNTERIYRETPNKICR